MKTLTIIDTFGFFFRLFYALKNLKTHTNKPSGMVAGFANFIFSLKNEIKSDYLIFALDSKGKTFRSEIDPNYKINRTPPPTELLEQIPVCIEMIEKMGFKSASFEGYEADDIIASVVKECEKKDIFVRIITQDKDLYQLIKDGKSSIYSPISKNEYNEAACVEKYGVRPAQIKDFLALCGDSSDNIPGVKGIGAKGAKTLLDEFENIEGIYEHLNLVRNERTKMLLQEGKENAFLSKKLASLYESLDVSNLFEGASFSAFESSEPLLKVVDILKEYELNALLRKLRYEEFSQDTLNAKIKFQNANNLSAHELKILDTKKQETAVQALNNTNLNENLKDESLNAPNLNEISSKNLNQMSFEAVLLNDENKLFELLNSLEKNTPIAFDTETTGLDTKKAKIVGFSFCFNASRAFYVPVGHDVFVADKQISKEAAKRAVETIFSHFVIGHNLKYDFEIVRHNFGLNLPLNYADTMILAWLYNPALRVNMDDLAKRLFSYETLKFENLVKKGQNFANVELENACKYAAEDAFITLKFYEYFKINLEKNLQDLATNVEFPFIKIILMLENNGIKLDCASLESLMKKFSADIKEISEEIYTLAGERFNINSPKQVGEVLFAKLHLPSSKKNKSGVFSTDEKVLNELKDTHPVILKILDYRELAKLYSTYCEPLLSLALKDKNSRIYSSFLQTGTATGRLSSRDPNLQNIPAHGQYAKDYKTCFVAREGFSFLSLDYSQIELRMLAHFSGDEKLLKAFAHDEDIHARTAIMIFGHSDYNTRSIAKSINFGLIYGMGYRTLSKNLGIDAKLAKEYIEKYFSNFTSIKSYFEKVKASARKNGFISTLLGRKRYFDFANANAMMQAAYERESVNSILQGSAADIIKLASLEIAKHLDDEKRLILQIHDELIFEVKDEKLENFCNLAQNIMQNIVKLRLNLKTSSSWAKNWGDLK